PVSATRPHRAVPGPVSPAAQERMTEGMSDLASSESMLPEKSTSSGSSANCMTNTPGSAARKAEETLGDDVRLDLVGAGGDGAGEGEQVTVHPLLTGELARGAQDVQCGLVGRDVPVRPEDLVDRGLKAQVGPAGELGDRVPGAQLVGAGADPGVHDAVGQGA